MEFFLIILECPAGSYGADCTQTCHCDSDGSDCEKATGVCTSSECSIGWTGENCQGKESVR